jgi:NAD(P)-dependent dehydrogenase (short-subunit alcohol dehydrogenase family)
MQLADKVIVVTGAASGIGRALVERFARETPRGLVLADIDADGAAMVALPVKGYVFACDVGDAEGVRRLVQRTRELFGRIDLFCSNAGIATPGGLELAPAAWENSWRVNTMAHVWAAREAVPTMLEHGGGYLLQTVSAAGLLTDITSAPYSVTKHAALAFAEWLSVTYGDAGLKVSALCPQWVRTPLIAGATGAVRDWMLEGALEPAEVAEAAVQGIQDERFLILPHPDVAGYFEKRAGDYERWLKGMRRLRAKVFGEVGSAAS